MQKGEAVAEAYGECKVMQHGNHSLPCSCLLLQQFHDAQLMIWVEGRDRFVRQKGLGLYGKCPCEEDQHPLPTGERHEGAVTQFRDARSLQGSLDRSRISGLLPAEKALVRNAA